MEEIIINDTRYEILNIYQKGFKEKDLFLCRNVKTGIKECFQRFDIEYYKKREIEKTRIIIPRDKKRDVTDEDRQIIINALKQEKTNKQIIRLFSAETPIYKVLEIIKEERQKMR